MVALNVGGVSTILPLPRSGRLAFATDDAVEVAGSELHLAADAAAIVTLPGRGEVGGARG